MATATLGVILGNRDFFPDALVTEARKEVLGLFKKRDIAPVLLDEKDTKLGGVETYADAKKCAELFKANRDRIDGVLVSLPNFGDEKGVADTMKLSGLDVPILVQGYPDDLDKLTPQLRRDSFCGKISVCNNLDQAGIPYTLTTLHVVRPTDESFTTDLASFLGVCRVVKGMRTARLGAIGARPAAFNTVRYSEKILEANGISVTTVDWSEIFGDAERLDEKDSRVADMLKQIKDYVTTEGVPAEKLRKMAKLGTIITEWITENELDATAIQCWSSIQRNHGISPCTLMSMMSQAGKPSACELDVTGALTMYAFQLASVSPSALVDWNNNYGKDPDRCVLFHCGNWPASYLTEPQMSTSPILGTTYGEENTFGALKGRTPGGPITFGRLSTDDTGGNISGYVGEGMLTDDPLETFGTRAVINVPQLQQLMHLICKNGFEHHTAINLSHVADTLMEAFDTYLGWDIYHHEALEM